MNKDNQKTSQLVVIFGRTNVGKSTLFNCLTEKKQALVSDIPGTTRDSNIKEIEWGGKSFTLVDTGGIMNLKDLDNTKKAKDWDERIILDKKIQKQAYNYLKEAKVILFLTDVKSGILPQDKELAALLKKDGLVGKTILAANKADSPKDRGEAGEFYRLNLGEPVPVSATNGSGTGDLLDLVVKKLKKSPGKKKEEELDVINILIAGKPNVGKSSLFNSILEEDRVIVSPIPHTTREPQDEEICYNNYRIKFVDTAGISRKGMQKKKSRKMKKIELEKLGIEKSLTSLNQADIVLLIMDISQNISHQETKIIDEILGRKKSLIIIANKWDLIPEKDTKKYTEYIRAKLPFINWVPILFISAKTGSKVKKIMDLVIEINQLRSQTINSKKIEKFLKTAVKMHPPTKGKGQKRPRLFAIKQVRSNPPEFEVRIGAKESLHDSYIRFLENRIRTEFNFQGTPVIVRVKKGRIIV